MQSGINLFCFNNRLLEIHCVFLFYCQPWISLKKNNPAYSDHFSCSIILISSSRLTLMVKHNESNRSRMFKTYVCFHALWLCLREVCESSKIEKSFCNILSHMKVNISIEPPLRLKKEKKISADANAVNFVMSAHLLFPITFLQAGLSFEFQSIDGGIYLSSKRSTFCGYFILH